MLSSLIEKSLVRSETGAGGEPRFLMLELIRKYAAEQLENSGETDRLCAGHAEYFAALARLGADGLIGPERVQWRRRLDADLGNIRAAMSRCLVTGDIALGLTIADVLVFFWYLADHVTQACQWFELLLETVGEVPLRQSAKTLTSAAVAFSHHGDHERSKTLCQAGLELERQAGKRQTAAWALLFLGANQMRPTIPHDAFQAALALFEGGMDLFRQVNNNWRKARILTVTGECARLRATTPKPDSCIRRAW